MSIPTYVQGFPQDGSSLGSTKAQIRANLDGTFLTVGVDHYNNNGSNGSNTGPAGYHAQIRMPRLPSAPVTASGQGALYTKEGMAGTDLFWTRDNVSATEVPMTISGLATPFSRTQNGYTFLPGNLLIQWGFFTLTAAVTPQTISFTPNFANVGGFAPIVTITLQSTLNPSGQIFVNSTAYNEFVVQSFTSRINSIYWHAIGPI